MAEKRIEKERSIMELIEEIKEQQKGLKMLLSDQDKAIDDLTISFIKAQKIISKLEQNYGE